MGERHHRRAKLFLGTAAACLLAAGLATPARAGSGPSHTVPLMPTAPTIDGTFSTFEWDAANSYPVSFGAMVGTVYVGRTSTDLYLAIVAGDAGGAAGDSDFVFDNNDDGVIQPGEDLIALNHGELGTDWYAINSGLSTQYDTTGGGTNDVTAKETNTGEVTYVEYRHPLCSSDTTHDFCFLPPATESSPYSKLGFTVGYFNPARTVGGFDPAGIVDFAHYANLVIPPPDTTPPTVTLEQPTARFVARGTEFVASASDTGTGVDHVTFQYRVYPEGTWTDIATATAPDADGKWHATWNDPPPDGHYSVRAVASDKLGNQGSSNTPDLYVDTTGPAIDAKCFAHGASVESPCKWFTSVDELPVFVQWQISDSATIAVEKYTTDGSDPLTSDTAHDLPASLAFTQSTTVRFGAVDALGNKSGLTVDVGVDTSQPPAPALSLENAQNAFYDSAANELWYRPADGGSFTLRANGTDPESGIASAAFPGPAEFGTGWDSSSGPDATSLDYFFAPNIDQPPGYHDVTFTNGAGLSGPATSFFFTPDSTPPTGAAACVPVSCSNPRGPVVVSFHPHETQSGVAQVMYTTDGSDPSATNGTEGESVTVTTPDTVVKWWTVDHVGNQAPVIQQPVGQASPPPLFAPSVTASTPSAVSVGVGVAVHDSASVAPDGVAGLPQGTVQFSVCGPFESAAGCSEGGTPVGTVKDLPGDGGPVVSDDFTPTAAGWWCFRASYSGDRTFAPSQDASPGECFQATSTPQPGPTFTVNTAADVAGSCAIERCTLRAAIQAANAYGDSAAIHFAIPTPSPTIQPTTPLPAVTNAVTIDATTELGALGPPIVLDGSLTEGDGLVITADNATVRGFVIEHFGGIGIHVLGGTGDTITGNFVGLGPSGLTAAGNGGDGIRIENGAQADVHGNAVGGNGGHGIFLLGTTGSTVQANSSGTDAAGTHAIGNAIDGIAVDGGSGNRIVGNTASGNHNQGISLFGVATPLTHDNVVQGNRVGLGSKLPTPVPNGGDGIRMFNGADNTIGGIGEGEPNTIAGNGGAGVAVLTGSSTGNSVRGNTIYGNGRLGIDLGGDGVTANDPGDPDTGPNDLQNFPVLSPPVRSGSTVTVSAKLVSGPNTRYVVDAYANTACAVGGFGEGETWSGSAAVTTDADGAAPVTITFNLPEGATATAVTLTATDAVRHETSEFSQCQTIATVGTTTDATVTLSADASSAEAGASVITLATIPRSAFMPPPPPAAPIESSPIESSPIESSPIESSGFTPANLRQNALGGVPLSQLPLKAPKTWAAVLGSPVVEQSTTLADALALQPRPAGLATLSVGDIDWAHAGTGLASLGVGAFAFGSVQLSDIGLGGAAAGAPARAAWCHAIDVLQGFQCSDPATLNNTTLMDIALQGVPIESSGLGAAPIESSNLAQAPIESSPIESSTLAGTPIESSPLDSVDLNVSVLGGIHLSAVLATASPLRGIATAALPGGELSCGGACPGTLGAAFDGGKVNATATVRDLGGALHGFTIGDLKAYPGVTVGNIGPGLPASLNLRDLLRALFAHIPFDPDTMPLAGIQDVADSGGLVTYTAQFTLTGAGANTVAELHAALAPGARYVPGSTKLGTDGGFTPYGDPGVLDGRLAWQLTGLVYGATYRLSFQVRPSLQLGRDLTQVSLLPVGVTEKTSNVVPVTVTDTFEGGGGNNTPATARAIDAGKAYLSFQQTSADQDWYSLPVPPTGTLTTITLSHLASDKDLVVFAPASTPLRSAPIESSPIESSPIESSPVPDVKPSLQQATNALQPVAVQDVPIESSQLAAKTIAGISDNTGTSNESVSVVASGAQQGGSYLIHIVASDPTPTSTPYMLRASEQAAPPLPPCTPRPAFANAGQGQAGALPAFAGVPDTTKTIVLVDYKRYGDTFGTLAENALKSELATFVARPEVAGVVLPVEGSPAVQAAYDAWDASPCAPENANGVVRAIISNVVDPFRSTHPNVKFLVIGGSDDIVPFPRVVDNTIQANEASYRSVLSTVNGVQVNNQLVGTAASAYMQTDDVWSAFNPTPFLGGQLYLPQWATGRLVETPAQIDHQLATYNGTGGVINPTTQLSVGYGFLADSAAATASAINGIATAGGPGNLISDTWTHSDLLGKLQLGQPSPAIVALNTHFDHHRALPAAGGQLFDSTEVNSSPSVLQTNSELGRLIFSVGCHSGMSVPDFLYSWPFSLDWPEADMSSGAVARVGNTTFGYGDTVVIGYSEQVEVDFAQRLSQMTLGEALLYAKQQYFADLGVFGPYEQKATNALTFYGLPMQHIGSPPAATTPLPQATTTDAATGLVALPIDSQVTFGPPVQTPGGEYFTGPDGVDATANRPFEPRRIIPDITQPNTMPHGFLITDLGINAQFAHVRIARSTPIPDSANLTPPLSSEVGYPSSLARVSSFASPTGPRQQLVLTHGQFLSDAGADSTGLGTQTNFGRIKGLVLYSPNKDAFPVQLSNPRVTRVGNTLGIEVDATDTTDVNGTAGVVKEVVAVYLEPGATTSHTVYLTQTPGTNHWSGGGALSSASTNEVSYIIQGVDASGNVGRTVHKVAAASVNITQGGGGGGSIGFTVSGANAAGGWYDGPVTVTVTAPAGDPISFGVDGSALRPYTAPFTISGEGLHFVDAIAQNADGTMLSGQKAVPIDTSPPTIRIDQPTNGLVILSGDIFPAAYSCSDGGSGIAAGGCRGTVAVGAPIDATAGTKTFTVTATDNVGRTSTASVTYTVWQFTGFLNPVNNPPTLNVANPGSAIPVKFQLGGNRGLNFLASGYPASQKVSCNADAPLDLIEQTVTAGASSLQYDAGANMYTYVWKTDKSWSGTCRDFTLKLPSGSSRVARFKFK